MVKKMKNNEEYKKKRLKELRADIAAVIERLESNDYGAAESDDIVISDNVSELLESARFISRLICGELSLAGGGSV